MKAQFHFSLLRFVYDPLTQEFLNIGVVLFSPENNFLQARFTSRYGRISRMFGRIDGASFKATTSYIERKVTAVNDKLVRGLLFQNTKEGLDSILNEVLPPDDSAIRFVFGGVGVSDDLSKTLDELFERYVGRYESPNEYARRDENDVWKVFQEPLRAKHVYSHLVPKKITAKDYEYEFERSWKNGVWHLFEPVSFDLSDERLGLPPSLRQTVKTLFAVRCKSLDRQDHFIAF